VTSDGHEATPPPRGGGGDSWRNELAGDIRGPVIQARSIHGDVRIALPREHVSLPTPRQLPPAPANVTGRSRVLADLNHLAIDTDPARRLAVVVLIGVGGVGKTALAAHWLHSISGQYDGGALYSDLRGHLLAEAASPSDVVAGFLRALCVAPERVPQDIAERTALYRSLTAGHRMVVLLDNAASAAQARVLLPGPGPEAIAGTKTDGQFLPSLVVVTSRWRITSLALDGARFVDLGLMDDIEALELFRAMIGSRRALAEPDECQAVVRLCGAMPLAVCVVGARLAARPSWPVSQVMQALADEQSRLTALSLTDDLSIRAVLDVSYRSLSPAATRAYALTALIPGPFFDSDLAAAVLRGPVGTLGTSGPADAGNPATAQERARALLDELADASLLTEFASAYHFHDLVRLHAREKAGSAFSAECRPALDRAVTLQLERAVAADIVVNPGRWRLNPMYGRAEQLPHRHASVPEALDWLEAHLDALMAAVQAATAASLHQQAWQLCEALWGVFVLRKHFQDWISSHLTGLASAQACGDQVAESRIRIQLGLAFQELLRYQEAREQFTAALALARDAGHGLGEAAALEQVGLTHLATGRGEEAIATFTLARDIHRRLRRPRGIAIATRRIGEALRDVGRPDEAIAELTDAGTQFAALPDRYMEARTLTSLALVSLLAGRPGDSIQPLRRALVLATELGARYEQARIARYLGTASARTGDLAAARDYLGRALLGFEDVGAPEAAEVRREAGEVRQQAITIPDDDPLHGG
jgi:tetratricopeptide (TPR) repeat protein